MRDGSPSRLRESEKRRGSQEGRRRTGGDAREGTRDTRDRGDSDAEHVRQLEDEVRQLQQQLARQGGGGGGGGGGGYGGGGGGDGVSQDMVRDVIRS